MKLGAPHPTAGLVGVRVKAGVHGWEPGLGAVFLQRLALGAVFFPAPPHDAHRAVAKAAVPVLLVPWVSAVVPSRFTTLALCAMSVHVGPVFVAVAECPRLSAHGERKSRPSRWCAGAGFCCQAR